MPCSLWRARGPDVERPASGRRTLHVHRDSSSGHFRRAAVSPWDLGWGRAGLCLHACLHLLCVNWGSPTHLEVSGKKHRNTCAGDSEHASLLDRGVLGRRLRPQAAPSSGHPGPRSLASGCLSVGTSSSRTGSLWPPRPRQRKPAEETRAADAGLEPAPRRPGRTVVVGGVHAGPCLPLPGWAGGRGRGAPGSGKFFCSGQLWG